MIGPESQRKDITKSYKNTAHLEIRFVPYSLPTGMIIYGDKVATMIWSDTPTAFVIQSKTLADSYKDFFEHLWKSSSD